jgi:threonine synthase
LELFHGRTQAFKDMALTLLPALLTGAAKRERPGVKSIILTATSGDTGKAALAAFADVPGVEVVVFYPEQGVSEIQKLQMTTQEGANTYVIGVRGNFDDAQTGVKRIFNDDALAERLKESNAAFSSANSINIGRLLPQIVYYVYAYARLCDNGVIKPGGEIDFAVPTGNFGNILAGYYAKRMGLPVGKLICASNSNNVLHEFFQTGVYDARRAFHVTQSPSMDILVSSNLERLLYHVSNDAAKVRALMEGLSTDGRYEFEIPSGVFESAFADENETSQAIKEAFELGYLCDPHTAVAYHAAKRHKRPGVPVVVLATASPYKFASSVAEAIGARSESDPFKQMRALNEASGAPIPPALKNLRDKPIRHTAVCEKDDMKKAVTNII